MRIQDLRIGTRIWFAVGAFIVALLALVAFAAWRSAQVQAFSDEALALSETKIRTAARWAGLTEGAVSRAQAGAISSDPSVRAAFKETNDKAIAQITELQKQLKEMPQTDAETQQMAKIAADHKIVLDTSAVITKKKEAGEAVNENEVVFRVIDISRVYLQVFVDAQIALTLKNGQAVQVTFPEYHDLQSAGTIDFIDPRIDGASGLVRIKVLIDNADRKLIAGMRGSVAFKS
jgi:multidrug efflux pump subunit AcrA (membrane-fusion protein)